jgi:DNA-binding beta-propeller fold protein YncE
MNRRAVAVAVATCWSALTARTAGSQANDRCNRPAVEPSITLALPGSPFQALPSADGCWIFAGLLQTESGTPAIAVIERRDGNLTLRHLVPAPAGPAGMTLTHDGKLLIASAGESILIFDVARLTTGAGDALVATLTGDLPGAGRVYANVSPDDRLLFVSDERAKSISVVDLAAARARGFKTLGTIGRIPTGRAPIALTFSRDGRWLYTTSQVAPGEEKLPLSCRPQANPTGAPDHAYGAIIVVDVTRAATRPDSSVAAVVEAGCNPVRLYLNAAGDAAYVTARGENAVLVFDPRKFLSDPARARIARVPVGTAPVGIVGVDGDRRIIATNSNRFAGSDADRQSLSVIDASRVGEGAAAVVGEIPAGAFPRELRVTNDGKSLIVTNFNSKSVQLVDIARTLGSLKKP